MSDELVKKENHDLSSAIIDIVRRTDIDPERLEKFLDIQERMENKQATIALNEALSGFQGECPIIKKTKRAHNSNYAPFDELVHVVKPILSKHGLSYFFDTKRIDETYSLLITTIRHKLGAEITSNYEFVTLDDGGKMNSSQRKKSAFSYARRAGLEAALGIATADEDDDARRAVDNPITEDQIKEIMDISEKTGTNEDALLKHLNVSALTDLSSIEAKDAITKLKRKRAAINKGKE